MGRYKQVEIEGLFFEDFSEILNSTLINLISTSKLSEKEIAQKIASNLDGIISDYEDILTNTYLENHNFKIDDFLKVHFKNQRAIVQNNRDSFISFILYITACANMYEQISVKVNRKRIDSTLKINISLYGLMLRRAQEIVDLLVSGYIDGAMIIWRAMYEDAIILLVLALENNAELSNKFYEHSIRNSQRKIAAYNSNHKALKFPPLPKKTEINLNKAKETLGNKYGKDFLKNDFGWADDLFLGNKKADFRVLEERAEMSRFRPYYVLCSEQIHSNFNGLQQFMTRNKIVLPKLLDQDIELKAFIDPMQFTISILHEVNHYILYEFSVSNEFDVNYLFLEKVFERLQKSFKK